MMPRWAQRLIDDLEAADRQARSLAGRLSVEQLNWRPAPDSWSIGQCLRHLLDINELYLAAITPVLRQPKGTVEELVHGWFGSWFLRNFIEPSPQTKRARAPKKIDPPAQVEPGVLEAFLKSNQEMREVVRTASAYDVNRIRFPNPFIPLIRFPVGTGLEIVAKHQTRHLLQAARVKESAGFPRQ